MGIPFEQIVEEDLNLGVGTVSVTNPGGGQQTGHQISRRTFHPFSVHYYGAAGDGLTDDTRAFQRAIDAAARNGGGIVWVPNGTYRLTSRLTIGANSVRVIGESQYDAILVWDDVADYGIVVDTPVTDPVTSALTADVALGDRTIAVASGAAFPVGAWVVLDDSAANSTALQTRVHSVVGNNVTLEDACPGILTVAASAQLLGYINHPLLTGIAIRDLTLQCATPTPSRFLGGLFLSRCDGVEVDHVVVNGSSGVCITTRQLYGGHIRNSRMLNAITTAGSGIENQSATTGLLIEGNEMTMCQFGCTFASAPYCRFIGNRVNGRQTNVNLGRGVRFGESSNFGVIANNTLSDMNLYGIYCQDSAFCTIVGNTIGFNGSATDTGEHGIQLGGLDVGNYCNHCTVVGNVITSCSGYAIAIANQTAAQFTKHTITGNTLSLCRWGAIFCNGSENTITGNICTASGATVIGGLIRLTFGADYNTVTGNTLTNLDTSGTNGITSSAGGGHNNFDNNLITTPLYLPQNDYAATDTIGATTAYVDAAILHAPLFNTTEVATPASLVETTGWSIPIPAGAGSKATHGVRVRALFLVAPNTNAKTLRAKIGANVFTGQAGGAGFGAQQYSLVMDMLVVWTSSTTAKGWVFWNSTQIATSFGSPGGTGAVITGIDWTAGFDILLTMQNGSASAADLTFIMGELEYVGVPQGS